MSAPWPPGTTCDECGRELPAVTVDQTGLCDDCLTDVNDAVIAARAAFRGEFDETPWDDVAAHVGRVVSEVKQLDAMLEEDES